jgi:hypothetical protein
MIFTHTVTWRRARYLKVNYGCESRDYSSKAIIAELRLSNEKAHQLTHALRNLFTVGGLILEQFHRIHTTLRLNHLSSAHLTSYPESMSLKRKSHPNRPQPKTSSILRLKSHRLNHQLKNTHPGIVKRVAYTTSRPRGSTGNL